MTGPTGGKPPFLQICPCLQGSWKHCIHVASNGLPGNPSLANREAVADKTNDTIVEELPQPRNRANKWKLGQCIPKENKIPNYAIHS